MTATITGVQLATRAFDINKAFADSGTIVELHGHNDSPQLNKIEAVWGLKGEPYCAMGQYWCFAKAYCDLSGIHYTPRTAARVFAALRDDIEREWLHFSPLVASMQAAAVRNRQWRAFTHAGDFDRLEHGDLVLYKFPTGNHIEMFDVIKPGADGHVWTVGWNTSAAGAAGGNSNDPGKGGGCYYKDRKFSDVFWGWIHWQGGPRHD